MWLKLDRTVVKKNLYKNSIIILNFHEATSNEQNKSGNWNKNESFLFLGIESFLIVKNPLVKKLSFLQL